MQMDRLGRLSKKTKKLFINKNPEQFLGILYEKKSFKNNIYILYKQIAAFVWEILNVMKQKLSYLVSVDFLISVNKPK